jgi:hypothetical protein
MPFKLNKRTNGIKNESFPYLRQPQKFSKNLTFQLILHKNTTGEGHQIAIRYQNAPAVTR